MLENNFLMIKADCISLEMKIALFLVMSGVSYPVINEEVFGITACGNEGIKNVLP